MWSCTHLFHYILHCIVCCSHLVGYSTQYTSCLDRPKLYVRHTPLHKPAQHTSPTITHDSKHAHQPHSCVRILVIVMSFSLLMMLQKTIRLPNIKVRLNSYYDTICLLCCAYNDMNDDDMYIGINYIISTRIFI
jgi:hypothetical protein